MKGFYPALRIVNHFFEFPDITLFKLGIGVDKYFKRPKAESNHRLKRLFGNHRIQTGRGYAQIHSGFSLSDILHSFMIKGDTPIILPPSRK